MKSATELVSRITRNRDNLIISILFLVLWIYLLLRIIKLPLIDDEINTWFIYINHNRVLPLQGYVDANNHILNSVFAWFFVQFLGSSPVVLRLPNFLFFPVYVYYSWKISGMTGNRFIRFSVFLGTVMAHHLFDFYGLCRGYGIALAMLLGACYHLIHYFRNHKLYHLSLFLLFAFLMVWAHLSLLGTAYMFAVIITFHLIFTSRKINHRLLIYSFVIAGFILILGYSTWYSMHLNKVGKIYLGRVEGGYIKVSVLSLINVLFKTKSLYLFFVVALLFAFTGAGSLTEMIRKGITKCSDSPLQLFFYLITGNIVIILLSHRFLDVVYPMERATLYMLPMLLFAIGFAAGFFIQTLGTWKNSLMVIPILFIPIHFIFSLNLDYASAYRWESYPERFISQVVQNSARCDIYPIVGAFDEDRWNYANFRNDGEMPYVSKNAARDTAVDYMVNYFHDEPFSRTLYDSIDFDRRNDIYLLKRKNFLKRTPIARFDNLTTNGMTEVEYFGFAPGERNDTLCGTHFLYYFDLTITCNQRAFEGFIIASLKNSEIFEEIRLDRVAEYWQKRRIRGGILVRESKNISKTPFAYFWNKEKVPYSIENGSLVIYRLGCEIQK
jgi:hypothetical protein